MKSKIIFTAIFAFIFTLFPGNAFADSVFTFTETFDSTSKINQTNSRVKINDGKVFVSDDSVSSRVESSNMGHYSWRADRMKIEALSYIPSGARIIYYLSNDGGTSWREAQPGSYLDLPSYGSNIKWAAVLARSSSNAPSPYIETLWIVFLDEGGSGVGSNIFGSGISYGAIDSGPGFVGEFYADINCGLAAILGLGCGDRNGVTTTRTNSGGLLSNNGNGGGNNGNSNGNQNGNGNGNGSGNGSNGGNGGNGNIITVNSRTPRLVRVWGTKEVYYITRKGLKRYVPNVEIFFSYNNRWADVANIDYESFIKYPDNKYIFLETNGTPRKVYRIEGNNKYLVPDSEIRRLGIGNDEIAPINLAEFNYYKLVN